MPGSGEGGRTTPSAADASVPDKAWPEGVPLALSGACARVSPCPDTADPVADVEPGSRTSRTTSVPVTTAAAAAATRIAPRHRRTTGRGAARGAGRLPSSGASTRSAYARSESRSRCSSSSDMAISQVLLQGRESPRGAGLHGAARDPEGVGDLGLAELRPVAQHEHLPLPPGQGAERLDDRPLVLGEEEGQIGRWQVLLTHRVQVTTRHAAAPVEGADPVDDRRPQVAGRRCRVDRVPPALQGEE